MDKIKKILFILILIFIVFFLQGCAFLIGGALLHTGYQIHNQLQEVQEYMDVYPYLKDLILYNNNLDYFFTNDELDINRIHEIEEILNKYPEFHRLAKEKGILTSEGGKFHLSELESKAQFVENNLELENIMDIILKHDLSQKQCDYLKDHPTETKKLKENSVTIGMPNWMVKIILGEPDDINKTVTKFVVREQWVYERGAIDRVYLYFDDGELTSWQE